MTVKNKKRFICFFPEGTNVHLIKDVGMIPYYLFKEGFFDSYISFYESATKLPYLKTAVKGLKYKQMRRYFRNNDLNIFLFILRHLFHYQVIMLFHLNINSIILANILKILTFGKMKFYIKLDMNDDVLRLNLRTDSIKGKIMSFLCRSVDLFSVETKFITEYLLNDTYLSQKIQYVPNGCKGNDGLPFEKEKIFITVGRLGAKEKDTLTLLEAFAGIGSNHNWKLQLVGPIESSFEPIIADYFLRNPSLRSSVEFTGPITDRNLLEKKYQSADTFILTSIYEGFPIASLEAMSNGCFVLSTDLTSVRELVNDNNYGRLFEIGDANGLSRLMQDIITGSLDRPSAYEIRDYALRNYSWNDIVLKIDRFLK